jgi:hypothetical protein
MARAPADPQPTDAVLAAAARAGDAPAFARLAERHYPPVLRYPLRQVDDPELAADLARAGGGRWPGRAASAGPPVRRMRGMQGSGRCQPHRPLRRRDGGARTRRQCPVLPALHRRRLPGSPIRRPPSPAFGSAPPAAGSSGRPRRRSPR